MAPVYRRGMTFDPNKDRTYGSTANIVTRAYAQCGGVPKVQEILGLSRTRCYALADPDDPAEISYTRMVALTKAGATVAAEHLAALAGGSFVAHPEGEENTDWHAMGADIARRSAGLTAYLLESMGPSGNSPGEIDKREATALLEHIDTLTALLAQKRSRLRGLIDTD